MKKINRSSHLVFYKKEAAPSCSDLLFIYSFFSRSFLYIKAQPLSRQEGSLKGFIWAQMFTLVLTLLCTALAKHGNFQGSALIDCMKHLHGGQKDNFRERITVFHSRSFERIMPNTLKVLQAKNASMQTKKKSRYVGFFSSL